VKLPVVFLIEEPEQRGARALVLYSPVVVPRCVASSTATTSFPGDH
jgi:hypothetical protein